MKSHPLIKKIAAAGLLGRGCGTFPVAKKWHSVLNAPGREKYVICNVSESEPGIFKDEFILAYYPEKVIDGIKLAMDTLGAVKGIIYLKPLYYAKYHNKLNLLIGEDNIELFAKPSDDYIGGEESAMVNLMEGRREEPRFRPPFLIDKGFLGAPTLVNNCETFYQISLINDDKYRGERFFCLSGDETPRGVFQFPEKINLQEALLKSGHYPKFPFFVQLGGAMAGTCLNVRQLKDYQIQHYSGLIVHRFDKDEKELITGWLSFFRRESCGQCVPCREGTYRLRELFDAGIPDQALFDDIIFSMQNSAFCSLGKMAVTAITSYYQNIKKAINN